MLILVFLSAVTSLFSPILLNIWTSDSNGLTSVRIIILLITLVFSTLLEVMLIFFREKFAENFNIENFKLFIKKYFRLNYDDIIDKGPTNIIERIQQAVNNIYFFMTEDYIKIWSSFFIMIGILVIIMTKNIFVGIIMVCMIPVNYFGFKLLNKELALRSEKLQKESASGFQKIVSISGQTDYLKQCSSYDILLKQMEPAIKQIYNSMAEVNVFAQSASKIIRSVNNITQTLIMVLVVYQFINNNTSPVSLILFTILMPLYFNNLSIIVNSNLKKQDMNVSMKFIEEIEKKGETDGKTNISEINNIHININKLNIKGKTLAYNIQGNFKKGDVVWVCGESGTGKSTLMKLLLKFRVSNEIWIDKVNISDISNQSLRNCIEYLSQNVPIINATLRDNLFFNKKWSKKQEEQLLNEPILRSIFEKKDMDSMIEEGGANLSGGEKQRIALARILYSNADVLILDEVTSNIDKKSAEEILEKVMSISQKRIVFIISHDEIPEKYATSKLYLNVNSLKINNI